MSNFNKEGYSVAEVAQILHCSTFTVRNYINNGHLGASLSQKNREKGKHRRIRILKEHIAEYMSKHLDRFTKEELDTWLKYKPASVTKTKAVTEVHSLSDLTGAWANLVQDNVNATIEATQKKTTEIDSYSIRLDGRIAIGNVSKETATKIIDALLADEQICYNELTIKKGICTKEV